MIKADMFSFPCQFTGTYPSEWAGYTFLQPTTQNALHPGIDWNWGAGEDDYGKPILAIADGECVHVSSQEGIGYGEIIVIRHELSDRMYEFIKSRYGIDSRTLYSFYAHLKDAAVKVGQEISRGDLIGWIGKSGTTVSHLHQELYKAVPGSTWRYWPTLSSGWTKEKLQKYYVDTFDLVVNQPSLQDEDEFTKVRHARDSYWNDLMNIKQWLGVQGEYSLTTIKSRIEALSNFEVNIGEKDKQIKGLNDRVLELEEQLKKLGEEFANYKTQNAEVGHTMEAAKVVNEDIGVRVDSAIEKIAGMQKEAGKIKEDAKVIVDKSWLHRVLDGISGWFSPKKAS